MRESELGGLLTGKSPLISGGASGIGEAQALRSSGNMCLVRSYGSTAHGTRGNEYDLA